MPNYNRKMDCKRTSDIKRFRDITINAFQINTSGVNSINFDDATQFIASTGTNQPYLGSLAPLSAQAVSSSFPFYQNVNNAGFVFGNPRGRIYVGAGSITQSYSNNYLLNDIEYLVVMSSVADKVITFAITNGTDTSTATITLPLPNVMYKVIYKPNIIGVQAQSSQALGATVAGTPLLTPSTTITLASATTGNFTIFDTSATSWINNLAGSVLTASTCCLEEITREVTIDKTDRTCQGIKVGELKNKEEVKWTFKMKEIDIYSILIFNSSQLSFSEKELGKQVFTGTTPTGAGNITINIGLNRKISLLKVGGSVIQLGPSLNNLQPNQGNYNPTTGDLVLNGIYHSNQKITVRAGTKEQRLQMTKKGLAAGTRFYIEIPEYFEDGEVRTADFYGEVLNYTTDFITDNDSEYTVEVLELPNENNEYVTTIQ